MAIVKRIGLIILVIVTWPLVFVEVVIYTIRWVLTGISFPCAPFFLCVLSGDVNNYFKNKTW